MGRRMIKRWQKQWPTIDSINFEEYLNTPNIINELYIFINALITYSSNTMKKL